LSLAGISQPIPALGVSVCSAAPSSRPAAGYSSYPAACDASGGGSHGSSQSLIIVKLWAGLTQPNGTACSSTSTTLYITVSDSSLTHSSIPCIGPVGTYQIVNQSIVLSSTAEYAQWDCEVSNGSGTSRAAHSVYSVLMVALTMMFWVA